MFFVTFVTKYKNIFMEEKITKCSLFNNVSQDEIQTLFSKSRHVRKKYSKDSIIVFQNDVCVNLIILYSGKAIAEKINYGGKNLLVEELIAPRIFAPAFLYIKHNYYPVSVYALETCEVLMIPRDEFMKMLQANSTVLLNFLEIISEQTYFLNKKINILNLSLKGKIADFLLHQMRISGKDVVDMISHQRLADMFGVARPSLTRCLAEMQVDKMIGLEKKKVRIINRQALRNLAE